MRKRTSLRSLVFVTLIGTFVFAGLAFSRPRPAPGPGPGACPNVGMECLDVWDPVTCSNGVTYSNQCYADRACATGCVEGNAQQ